MPRPPQLFSARTRATTRRGLCSPRPTASPLRHRVCRTTDEVAPAGVTVRAITPQSAKERSPFNDFSDFSSNTGPLQNNHVLISNHRRSPTALTLSSALTTVDIFLSSAQHRTSTNDTNAAPGQFPQSSMPELKEGEFVGSLDCGTTSVRFIVFDSRATIIAQSQLEFPQYYPYPGWHEHHPDEIQQASEECITCACKQLEQNGWTRDSIKVIGITNQRETAVVWDRITGRPLCPAIVWDDARTKNTVAHFQHKLRSEGLEIAPGDFRKGDAGVATLRELTGLPLSTYFSAIKLSWMLENHKNVRAAHDADNLCFGTVESWLVYNFTGGPSNGLHITEPTNASRTLLLDIHSLQWSPALLRFFSLRPTILPRLVSSSEVYGTMSTGPLKGVQIAGLVGDQQGALVGNKCLRQGEAKCTYGTGAFLLFNTGKKAVSSKHGLLTTVAYQPGPGRQASYALEGSIAVAGSAINWLRDGLGMIKSSAEVNTLAAKEPTTSGVYFVTAFSGLLAPYWDPGAAGMLIGLTKYTNPSHIARAAIEAIAFQTRAVIESMLLDVSTRKVEEAVIEKAKTEESGSTTEESTFESDCEALSSPITSVGDSVEVHDEAKSPQLTAQAASLTAAVPDPRGGLSVPDAVSDPTAAPMTPSVIDAKFSEDASVDYRDLTAVEFTHLKVDGGVTNGDLCMQVLADIGGFAVVRPTMRESTALGSALLAGSAIGLYGWDLERPEETMSEVNTEGAKAFEPHRPVEEREAHWEGWKRAVDRSLGWDEAHEET